MSFGSALTLIISSRTSRRGELLSHVIGRLKLLMACVEEVLMLVWASTWARSEKLGSTRAMSGEASKLQRR